MRSDDQHKKPGNIFLQMHPLQRIAWSIASAAVVFLFVPQQKPALLNVLTAWLVFGCMYLLLNWIVLCTRPIPQIRKFAQQDDGSRTFVVIMIVLFSFSSLIIVLLLMTSKAFHESGNTPFVLICLAGILMSWFLVHTTYTFHYAHLFYDNAPDDNTKDAKGLEFPGDAAPDYIDFAYFAFVIGCCFQVSDVEVSSRLIRRSVLFHQLLSFGLNTFVVALTINLIAGLMK
ncbi:DUF1345 domain-containing protein [Ilyomonas limi]|uniref:DUF1345 domain-containing protein n=1 Tax=Ilyomonas limi TaxID=2575867 RepID=A0A4U3L409_9BACT|nr:DUF1345 domain-containing protein [Ilyomonas limi]TKK69838.1 DUF1345 domain-containing protein [Ilyomonas limi]